ncbi:hypothetical protein Anapl_16985 [Anas platyrhynchos]|uniref:Uncharacterized protein n=1 Tax=Anas platyrhynchos TaxID=8839 RepID=R0JJB4_ANAPL|nr:hypothetical protein Anapl_16985 [Anas platyrhynchos]
MQKLSETPSFGTSGMDPPKNKSLTTAPALTRKTKKSSQGNLAADNTRQDGVDLQLGGRGRWLLDLLLAPSPRREAQISPRPAINMTPSMTTQQGLGPPPRQLLGGWDVVPMITGLQHQHKGKTSRFGAFQSLQKPNF